MTSSAVYDDDDGDGTHLTSSTDALGNTTSYTYNAKGLVSEVLDPMGYATNYTYDALERTKKVSAPIDSNSEAKVEYDYENDLLMSIRVNNSAVKYSFTYDSFGRKTTAKVGNGTDAYTLASYTYYDDGLLMRQYYGVYDPAHPDTGTYVGYIYDNLDRVSKKRYNASDNASAEYSYDPNGNLRSVKDTMWGKTTQYEYDLAGRVVGTATIGNTVRFARAYEGITYTDGKGTIDSYYHKMVAANGDLLKTTNYTFTYGDAASGQIPDALYTMVAGGKYFHFKYDTLGRLYERTINFNSDTNKTEKFTYKNNGQKTSTVVASKTDFTGVVHEYQYDANGNITKEIVGEKVREYKYDSLNRLEEYSDPFANISESYEYDERGNITKVHTGEYNSTEQSTITYTYGSKYQDRFKYYNDIEIEYGKLGNPTKWINGKSMTWQYGRNLITVGDNITYAYNADGLRISKSGARNTEYYIVGGKYVGEVTTISGTKYTIAYIYDETDSVIGINVTNQDTSVSNVYYFAKNLQGDVVAILNYQGDVVARYTYDVWGKLIAVKNADGDAITSNTHIAHLNPFRYRGYMYDKETGFYYLRSRYYDPEIGRWLNADNQIAGVGGEVSGYNVFAYCMNNPVNMSDPTGNWPKWATIALGVAAAAVAVAATVVTFGAAAPAAVCSLTMVGMSIGASYAAAHAVATVAVVATAVAATVYAADVAYSAVTGDSPLKETVFRGNQEAYDTGLMVTSMATGGVLQMAAQSPGVCFVAGTLIATKNGEIPIESIEPDALVWATNPETGETELKKVVQTFVNETDELIHITINKEKISTTPEHPFYVPQKGWTAAVHLRAGDRLQLLNGEYVVIELVQHEILETPITVYNFEVEGFHTYHVGKCAVLVHNTCGGNSSSKTALPKNGTKVNSSVALDMANDFLGPGYTEVSPSRFVSADGFRQVRMANADILGLHGGGPHINFDRLYPNYKSVHIYIFDD